MNLNKIFTIYKKELLDLIRDRRTVITSFVLPVILYPLIMIGFSSMMMRQETKLEQETLVVYIHDNLETENSNMIQSEIAELETFQIMNKVPNYLRDTYIDLINEKSIQGLIEISDSLSSSGYQVIDITVFYDETKEKSKLTYRKVKDKLYEIEDKLISERLTRIKINKEILNAVNINNENIAPPEQMVGFALGKFLPYLLIILTISGASVVASDLIAGEKERGTLETILVSGAKRFELVLGKYLTIITISIITVLLNLFSMYISFQHIFKQAAGEDLNFQLPITNFVIILLIMIPLITLFSALLLSLSTFSRNTKEAHSYQMPIMFGAIMLSMVSFLPGFELNFGFSLIPIVNYSLLIRNIMLNSFQLKYLFTIVGITILFDVVMVYISINLFNNESVLFRTSDDKPLKFWGKNKNIFSPQFVTFFFILVTLSLYYVGGSWQAKDLMQGLMRTEIILIFFPTILLLKISKTNIKKTMNLKLNNPVNFLIILLSTLPLIIISGVLSQLINMVYPVSESYLEGLKNVISNQDISLWKNLLIVALLPGICEEVMFRGYIINGFLKQGKWRAIIITGVLFGIMHLDPFRFIPVTLLGIWMGYLLIRTRSLYIPIFAHILNNGFAILLANFGDKIPFLGSSFTEGKIPFYYILPAIVSIYYIIKWLETTNSKVQIDQVLE